MHFPEAKKSLGQNFLHDMNVKRRICAAINPQEGENIVEIGPGVGALTELLLEAGANVTVLEKDTRFIPILEDLNNKGYKGTIKVIEGDALADDFSSFYEEPFKLVGNLPYNIGTEIVIKALEKPHQFKSITILLQKEVIERICAKPNTKDWGRLAVLCSFLSETKYLFDVPPGCFHPVPKVMSALGQLIPMENPRFDVELKKLSRLTKQAFGQRRKMLRASLKGLLTIEQIEETGIDPQARPETLSLEDFCKLTEKL